VDDGLIIVDGATFFYGDRAGDAEAEAPEGFFYEDVRHLSRWCLTVDGEPLAPLTSRVVDHFSSRIVGACEGDEQPTISIRRDRFVTEGMHEDVDVTNHGDREQRVRLEISFASDFADVMEAQREGTVETGRYGADLGVRVVTLWQNRDGYRRGTAIRFQRRGRLRRDRMTYDLRLRPGESWHTCIDVIPIVGSSRRAPLLGCDSFGADPGKMPVDVESWLEQAPELVADWDALHHIYRRSLLDLAALRLRPRGQGLRWALPAGGLPWFMTVFGRDSIIAAYEALPFHAELARATLKALASLQATEWDDFADAQPGKIMHELRRGTLSALGEVPGVYYGTQDATMLFLILLDEYERWTGDRELVRELEPNARAALGWLEGPADLDADGYVEYLKRSDAPNALENHCWKDSDDSIRFADGRRAEPPIAACEHQGYVYDARLRFARLAREIYDDPELADRLERDAASLRRRFNRDFWLPRRGHYALALDRDKRPVDSLTSNVGHLLWSGIVDERRGGSGRAAPAARRPAERLGNPLPLRAGCGLQPARVPQRHRLAARHGDRRRGHAPLRVPRRGRPRLRSPAQGSRGLRLPAARGLRRFSPRLDERAGGVSGRAQAAGLGGRRPVAGAADAARPRRLGRKAAQLSAPSGDAREGSPSVLALVRDAQAERDEHEAGHRVERPPDRRALQEARCLRDRRCVEAQPRERQHCKEDSEREHPRERRAELRQQAREEDRHLRVAEIAEDALAVRCAATRRRVSMHALGTA